MIKCSRPQNLWYTQCYWDSLSSIILVCLTKININEVIILSSISGARWPNCSRLESISWPGESNVLTYSCSKARLIIYPICRLSDPLCANLTPVPAVNGSDQADVRSGMVGLAPKWVRLAPNGTNPGLFQIRFQCIVKCTEI